MSTRYCLGFCFNDARDSVILMRKLRPDWQAGKLNGVGGKIEENEPADEAMMREFHEETGVMTHNRSWRQFATLLGESFAVYCYELSDSRAHDSVKTAGDEMVVTMPLKHLVPADCLSNLPWLIPMALDENYGRPFSANVHYLS